jgi:hypothetical protein
MSIVSDIESYDPTVRLSSFQLSAGDDRLAGGVVAITDS